MRSYGDRHLADRVLELAWTQSQVVLRQLDATEADTQLLSLVELPVCGLGRAVLFGRCPPCPLDEHTYADHDEDSWLPSDQQLPNPGYPPQVGQQEDKPKHDENNRADNRSRSHDSSSFSFRPSPAAP